MTKKEKAVRERRFFAELREREKISRLIKQAEARGVEIIAELEKKLEVLGVIERQRG